MLGADRQRGSLTQGGAAARVVLVQVMFQCVPATADTNHDVAPQHLGRAQHQSHRSSHTAPHPPAKTSRFCLPAPS